MNYAHLVYGGTGSKVNKSHNPDNLYVMNPEDKIENTNAFFQDLQNFIKNHEKVDKPLVNASHKPIKTSYILNGKVSFSEHLVNLKNNSAETSKTIAQPKNVVDSYSDTIIKKDTFVPVAEKNIDAPTPVRNITTSQQNNVPAPPARVTAETLSKQILLVEDDLLLRKSLAFYITDKGFKVVQAENGMEAIEHIKNKKFDLIITDLKLPYMGGMEVINIVRTELKLATPIIVLSVSGVEEVEVNSFTIGANEFIAKPFSPSVLMARIDNLLA